MDDKLYLLKLGDIVSSHLTEEDAIAEYFNLLLLDLTDNKKMPYGQDQLQAVIDWDFQAAQELCFKSRGIRLDIVTVTKPDEELWDKRTTIESAKVIMERS